jgi:hypothetical protein
MTTRPHDALFKSAFDAPADAAALVRELVPPSIRDAIAWDSLAPDRGSFIDRKLADLHGDLVFLGRLRVGARGDVVILLEHQSTDDPTMAQRMLAYQVQIWSRYRKKHPDALLPPVLAVLVSHVPGGWTAAQAFEELFDPVVLSVPGLAALVPRCSMITLDLAQVSNERLQAWSLGAFQKLALWALRDGRTPVRLLGNFEAWHPEMAEAGRTRSGLDALGVLFEYLLQVLDPVYWVELHAKIRALGARAEEATVTIAEMFEERGRARGRVEGRISTLRSLLIFKFQTLDEAAEARLQAATAEAIDRYLQRVLTADSLAAVFED